MPTTVQGASPGLFVDGSAAPGRGGRTAVVVVNAAQQGTPAARLVLRGADRRQATVLRLTAPSPTAQTGVSLGGAQVRADGTWRANGRRALPVNRDGVHVRVPAGSAAVVELAGRTSG